MPRWLKTRWFALLVLAWCAPARVVAEAAPPLPIIERVEPSAGPPGTLLRITGRRLRGDTRVLLGDAELSIELSTPTLITARVARGMSSGLLRLESSAGALQGPRFSVMPAPLAPVVRRIAPARAGPGAQVVLAGEHFSLRLAENEVRFGTQLAIVDAASATQLQVTVPEGAGVVSVRVRVQNASEPSAPTPFEILARLSLQQILPPRAAERAQLVLHGSGFDLDPRRDRVWLGTRALRVLEASATRLKVVVPQDAESGPMRVSTAGAPELSVELPFEVVRAPSIAAIEPLAGPVGTEVRVRGQGFGDAVQVALGERALPVLAVSASELRARVPAAAVSGKISVAVDGRGRALAANEFIVTAALALDDMQPRGGPRGSEVVLIGRGFSPRLGDQTVTFAGVAAQLLAASPERLTLRVPEAKTGPVVVALASQRAESRVPFEITQPPRIDKVSAEAARPATELRVLGAGFGSNPALVRVTLAERSLRVVSVCDAQLVVKLPDEPVSGELSVRVALQGGAIYPRPIRVATEP